MFIGISVKLGESFPHHVQLGLAVPLEDLRIALPQHLGYEVVRYSPCTEPSGKRMPKVVQRKI